MNTITRKRPANQTKHAHNATSHIDAYIYNTRTHAPDNPKITLKQQNSVKNRTNKYKSNS